MPLSRHRRDWEDLAVLDPLWAVSGKRATSDSPWTVSDFLATGEVEIEAVLAQAARLGRPGRRERALDFGCGLGRVTQALARRFRWCDAIDISEAMIKRARQLNHATNCSFLVGEDPDLRSFRSQTFDLVYSSFVLQHLPGSSIAADYISEFLRVARGDGLVVFQMPENLGLRARLQPRRRAYAALRRLGLPKASLRRLRLHPVRMIALSQREVDQIVRGTGGSIILTEPVDPSNAIAGTRYFVAPP